MLKHRKAAALTTTAVLLGLLGGCASDLVSHDKVVNETAMQLNVPASSIKISERRNTANGLAYKATTASGKVFLCTMDVGTFAITNPPQCHVPPGS